MTNLAALTSDYRLLGDTSLDVWREELDRLDSPWKDRAALLRAASSPLSALCLAMGIVENRWGSTGYYIKPSDNNPMSLRPWAEDPQGLPPGATGIIRTPDTGNFLRFDTPESCLREWKRRMTDPAYKAGVYTGARTLAEMIDIYAPPGDVHGGTGVDNADIGYASTVAGLLRKYAAMERPADDSAGNGTGGTGMKAHRFVGLDADVWLPDDIEVIIDIVPSRIGNVRSNQTFTDQDRTLYHQTGNFSQGANAWSERNYLHGGAGGRSVGYNFAVDDKRIIQLTPLDETTWSAGESWWNKHSWGVEQCVGGGLDLYQAERNACALHGGLCAAKGWTPLGNMYPHHSVYGKICPATIIKAGTWPDIEKRATVFHAQALAAAAGQDAGDAADDAMDGWPYPDAVAPSFWDALMAEGATHAVDNGTIWYRTSALYRVKTKTGRQQFAIEDKRVVGPELEPGTEFRAAAVGQSISDKETWVITPMLTRVDLDDLEYVSEEQEAA